MREYDKYVERTKVKLQSLPRGSKAWWKVSQKLMMRVCEDASISLLKGEFGKWALSAVDKANLFADAFHNKNKLPLIEENEYSIIHPVALQMSGFLPVRQRHGMLNVY